MAKEDEQDTDPEGGGRGEHPGKVGRLVVMTLK